MNWNENIRPQVREVVVKYFDTLPPTVSLAVIKSGYLFAASEAGPHGLYQIVGERLLAIQLYVHVFCQPSGWLLRTGRTVSNDVMPRCHQDNPASGHSIGITAAHAWHQ